MTEVNQNSLIMQGSQSLDFLTAKKNNVMLADKLNIRSVPNLKGAAKTDFPILAQNASANLGGATPTLVDISTVSQHLKRITAGFRVTQQTLNNTGDLYDAIAEEMSKPIKAEISEQAFGKGNATGEGDKALQSILDTEGIEEYDDIDLMFSDFATQQKTFENAILVVNSTADITKFKDGANNTIFQYGKNADGSVGTFHNVPVFVQDMNEKGKIVLMDGKAYGVSITLIKTEIAKANTDSAFKGYVDHKATAYIAGSVLVPEAIKIFGAPVAEVQMTSTAKKTKSK